MFLPATLVFAALAATVSCRPSHPRWRAHPAEAVYFMTNEAQNAVVALSVAKDGSLSTWTMTATGAAGGSLVSATDGTPNGPDALGSQGSVQVTDNVRVELFSEV